MRIVCAPDSFKESLSAREAADAMARGIRRVIDADITLVPMADGGEGTAQSVCDALGGQLRRARVTGPLGESVEAHYALAGDVAVVECAQACGLDLVPEDQRNPLRTTTRGVGELIAHAIDSGASTVIVGLGGSATNDGGAGLIAGLGGRVLTAAGDPIDDGAAALADAARIELPDLSGVTLRVACDVDNPLLGERGASAVFGAQKGASPEQVAELDALLRDYSTLFDADPETPGAGAAGGLGFALLALRAQLEPGVRIVADTVGLADKVAGADLVLVGEGSIDSQTLSGKTPAGVAEIARAAGAAVIAFAGRVADEEELAHLFDAVIPIVPGPCTLAEAKAAAADNLEAAVARVMRLLAEIMHRPERVDTERA